jgi:DNA polymerase
MTGAEPSLRLLTVEQVVSCTNCELHTQCTAPVAFSGPTPADIAIVAEAPGKTEDEKGEPLIGRAGQLLREHLLDVGLDGEKVTIAFMNTVSCYPNGTPTPEHVKACANNKEIQLTTIDPTWVLLMGKIALKAERPEFEIGRARAHPWRRHADSSRIMFATYHPAAALRNSIMEKSMNEDLHLFAAMVEDGVENWMEYISDRCIICGDFMYWLEVSGLAYCEQHMPEEGRARKAFVDADLEAARQRLAAKGA